MKKEHGSLSIESENIFPIIKKWLYSDHDIFVRELISNGCDAITKLNKLEVIGEAVLPEGYKPKLTVTVNAEDKTIQVKDNGIGMTAEEVKEYINQVAFSGATDFMEKYKDKANEEQIIGHFGLGFYSSFMVADRVTIDTKSYKDGSEAVHWESEGGTDFEMDSSDKEEFGTVVTLYLNDDSYEFSNDYRVREILTKYCSFMPFEIYLEKANAEQETETVNREEVLETDTVIEEFEEEVTVPLPEDELEEEAEAEEIDADSKSEEEQDTEKDKKDESKKEKKKAKKEKKEKVKKAKIEKRPVPINNTAPLWSKHPNDCKEEEYKDFYREVFHDYKEPLFWIHLNMDYPFNLKGILYFPKLNTEYDNLEGVIKLYNNQVFIADNIKEVIPEFLMLLKGVIDCPDLPLNVSRSALQNDGFVKKISDYISKKVADKLTGMCKTDRENYEKYWDDISPFIKFGCLKDEKFNERINEYIIYKDLDGKYMTLNEYLEENEVPEVEDAKETEENEGEEKEVPKTTVYYVTDEQQQSQYINMFREQDMNAFILTHNIDQPFVTAVESKNEKIRFQRIDAELTEDFKESVGEEDLKKETDELTKVFRKALGKENLEVKAEKLKNEKVSSMITLSEQTRRMQDMMKMYAMNGMGGFGPDGEGETLILNVNHELVQYIFANKKDKKVPMICEHLYDLASLAHKPLEPERMTKFIERSNEIMMTAAK